MPPCQPTPTLWLKGKQKLAPPLNKKTSRFFRFRCLSCQYGLEAQMVDGDGSWT